MPFTRLFHTYRDESVVKQGKNGSPWGKSLDIHTSRTLLVQNPSSKMSDDQVNNKALKLATSTTLTETNNIS